MRKIYTRLRRGSIVTLLTELGLPEDMALEGLNAVLTAKRIGNMSSDYLPGFPIVQVLDVQELHDSKFEKHESIYARKGRKSAN
ncbi:unnamed protein product [Rhizoctonia solani]|uniref:Uncharacterized protein n=1 Tax=Rhizoctonia solani TaxID=456999 RepID=A0A8H3AII6_9AGAM|nr:unnamed protein product [Rhizoctonia solani]